MTRKVKVLSVLVCILALAAGSVLAQEEKVPGQGFLKGRSSVAPAPAKHRGTPGSHPPYSLATSGKPALRHPAASATVTGAPVTGLLGYHPSLQLSSIYGPYGIGVSYKGDRIYFTESNDCDVYYFQDKDYKTYEHIGWYAGPIRNRGNLYSTYSDGYGDIVKTGPGGDTQWIGWQGFGCDYISAIDVDRLTGDVYFMMNCGQSSWAGIFVLPAKDFGGRAISLDEWYGDQCYGIAVKGNKLYTTSYWYGSVYVCDKFAENWDEILTGFNGPTDLGFDKLGNLFVAEWNSGSVARVRPGSTNVARIAVGLGSPFYLEIDGLNRVFVTDMVAGNIWMFWK